LTGPVGEGGRTAVHRVVEEHEGVMVFKPASKWSAPAIGKKPVPVIVTGVAAVVGPMLGLTPVIVLESDFVPYWRHMRAARPG
jgi:hypothetical protein